MEQIEEKQNVSDKRKIAIMVLIITTILWGTTFIITRNIIQTVPLHFYLGIRFLFALLIFIPFFPHLRNLTKREAFVGFFAGFIYFLSILVQTYGLLTTTAGKGGFITGLNTVIVPFIAWIFFKKPINKRIWIAVGLSVIGMALLLLEGENGVIFGDVLVLFCAFGFAIYIIQVDRDIHHVDIYNYLIIQLFVITMFCFSLSFLVGESINHSLINIDFWIMIIYMGCIASGITFLTQNWGEKHAGAAQTAIIFTLEPVFAVLFASFLIGDEVLTIQAILGGSLIFLAILITVLKVEETSKDNL